MASQLLGSPSRALLVWPGTQILPPQPKTLQTYTKKQQISLSLYIYIYIYIQRYPRYTRIYQDIKNTKRAGPGGAAPPPFGILYIMVYLYIPWIYLYIYIYIYIHIYIYTYFFFFFFGILFL